MVSSFGDLLSVMISRPQLLGSSMIVEFSFLGYLAGFECAFAKEPIGQNVIKLWRTACLTIHPVRPEFCLYCVDTSNTRILDLQMESDSPDNFALVGTKLNSIFDEVKREAIAAASGKHVFSCSFERLQELIETHFRSGSFFYHKARAYEGFLLGLISSYEYLFRGDFTRVTCAAKWCKEAEKLPFSSTRTLADAHLTQDQVVERARLYTEVETRKSYDQVRIGLKEIADKTLSTDDSNARRLLGL